MQMNYIKVLDLPGNVRTILILNVTVHFGQIGHFHKQGNSDAKKQKSMKNMARDKSRLQ
jgi:hypothetical protein